MRWVELFNWLDKRPKTERSNLAMKVETQDRFQKEYLYGFSDDENLSIDA